MVQNFSAVGTVSIVGTVYHSILCMHIMIFIIVMIFIIHISMVIVFSVGVNATVTVQATMHHVLLMIPLVRLVKLFEGKNDDEKDNQVCDEAEYPSDSEAIRNLFPIIVGIILGPRANIAEYIGHWNEEQNLDEDVPPFLDGSNDNVDDDANECDDH